MIIIMAFKCFKAYDTKKVKQRTTKSNTKRIDVINMFM